MNSISSARAAAARRALLKWYSVNARSLPWRGSNDPYAIWLSEVMLQQTQIATVIPYYGRFLRAFPTVHHLARAPFEKVAAQWSGLGYYRRARHLYLAAQNLEKDFAGRFPDSYEQARKLPGVGHYTACAVLSIAYGKPLPVLDGNVARVVARLNALRGNLHQVKFRSQVEQYLNQMLSTRRPGDFNQAMMELGQTLCLPHAPCCAECPLRRMCLAYERGDPELFPDPRPRRATEQRHLAVAVILNNGKGAFVRGLDEDLLNDLWNFPAAFGASAQEALKKLTAKLAAQLGSPIHAPRKLGTVRHTITFRAIEAHLYDFSGLAEGASQLRWLSLSHLQRAPVSQLAIKIAEAVRERYKARELPSGSRMMKSSHPREGGGPRRTKDCGFPPSRE